MAETTDLYRMLLEDPSAAFLAKDAGELGKTATEARANSGEPNTIDDPVMRR
jgi:hypothetical protein